MRSEIATDIEMKEFIILLTGAFTILAFVALLTSSGITPALPKGGVDSPDDLREMEMEWPKKSGPSVRFAGTRSEVEPEAIALESAALVARQG